jgi:galactonate dehydratase
MKIGRIETFLVPPRWLFVRVEAGDGAVGWGEASLEGHAEAVAGAFEAIRDRFLGHDAFAIEDIWQIAYRGGFYRGGPVLMSALSGLDQALWDLKGKALGLPAWQMLGGKVRDKVRAYAWIGGDRPDEIAEGRRRAARARLFRCEDERDGGTRFSRHAQIVRCCGEAG